MYGNCKPCDSLQTLFLETVQEVICMCMHALNTILKVLIKNKIF